MVFTGQVLSVKILYLEVKVSCINPLGNAMGSSTGQLGGGDDRFIVRVLSRTVFKNQKELAYALELSEASISRLGKPIGDPLKLPWTEDKIAKVIRLLAAHEPPIKLQHADWKLDEVSFEKRINQQRLGDQTIAHPAPVPFNRIEQFHGRFIRLFIKSLVKNPKKLAVHLGDFSIVKSETHDEARVIFRSLENDLKHANQQERREYELKEPCGHLKIIDNTLEMSINYGTSMPLSYYLGPRPLEGRINWFLMANLDIKFTNREVSANPMLFIRVNETDVYSLDPAEAKTPLYKAVRKFASSHTNYKRRSIEMLIENADGESVKGASEALHKLKIE